MEKLIVKVSTTVHAPVSVIWKVLTDPKLIREYLFGTQTQTDWKKGSPIIYSGTWNGKSYIDKGKIVDIIPEKLLHTTYLSGMSGKEDIPENYAHVIYELELQNNNTIVHLSQDNIENEKQLEHLTANWNMVLNGIKKVAERQPH